MAKKSIITYTKGRQHKIKLRGKRRAKGRISLYLDEYLGTKIVDGKTKTIRKVEYLDISLIENPSTPKAREENNSNLIKAENMRSNKEDIRTSRGTGLSPSHLKKMNFINYFEDHLNSYENKDKRLVKACLNHFITFAKKHNNYIRPVEVDEDLVLEFKKHLEKKLNGDTPLNYFTKFKALCKKAVKERILQENPCDNITIKAKNRLTKEILSLDEIALLPSAYCSNEEVKKAFLFSLNTGLRFVDVKGLKWGSISLKTAKMKTTQSKTKNDVYIDLNENAMTILLSKTKGKRNENVFHLNTIESTNKVLKNWIKKAEIDKHITFHCGRHSFGANLINNGANIKTVSSLLGHSSLRHTEKYTRAVDDLKKEAVHSLPKIEIENTNTERV